MLKTDLDAARARAHDRAGTIPVICDHCRRTGHSGEGDFAHLGDLLSFTPVPVQPRVNGWSADAQRAFIALLATTGSRRRAALAIGRNVQGIEQLMKREDGASLRAAHDRALGIARENGALRISSGVADAAARNDRLRQPAPSRLRRDPAVPDEEEGVTMDEEEKLALLCNLLGKVGFKVRREREARLAGETVSADFYLRQITAAEIGFELMAEGLGMDAWEVMGNVRRSGESIFTIAETDMSRLLDDARRRAWEAAGEPPRPEHPPRRYLVDKGDIRIEPLEAIPGGEEGERRKREYEARHAADAAAQAAWEAGAGGCGEDCGSDPRKPTPAARAGPAPPPPPSSSTRR